MKSALMVEEQETHINWNRGDGVAKIYVSDMTMINKLDKLVALEDSEWKMTGENKMKNGDLLGRFYECPVKFISFRSKRVSRNSPDETSEEIGNEEEF